MIVQSTNPLFFLDKPHVYLSTKPPLLKQKYDLYTFHMAPERLKKRIIILLFLHQVAGGPLTVQINADHVFVLKPKPQQHNSFIYFCTIKEASRADMPRLFEWRVERGANSSAAAPCVP